MRSVLIGHRGVGKSSLLKRIEYYYREAGRELVAFDLDAEISRRSGESASEIFQSKGEIEFRRLEQEAFVAIDRETSNSQQDVFVSLGAGFDLSRLPSSWRALWIRRPSDHRGRVFIDSERPRLNREVSPLAEYHERFVSRQKSYHERADETLFIDEGLQNVDSAEGNFFLNQFSAIGGALTLMPEIFRSDNLFTQWCERRLSWGVKWFEVRDDLLSEKQIQLAFNHLPKDRLLLSFRARNPSSTLVAGVQAGGAFDWPLELGSCPYGEPTVLSLHERPEEQSMVDALARLSALPLTKGLIKAALPVHDFNELALGHAWMAAAPEQRVFLPLSTDGRWSWYRLLMSPLVALSFFRESDGSGADQPTLLQWTRRKMLSSTPLRFAAVIGDPVMHSRTPIEQQEFFGHWKIPVVAIRMTEREWSEGAMEFLRSLGLGWAAVTAPLKRAAFALSARRERVAEDLSSVNTLLWDSEHGCWRGTNTDQMGFRALLGGEDLGVTAICGGGGTLAMMKSVLPQAECFSARTGENRNEHGARAQRFRPDTVIWASGGKLELSPNKVQSDWRPRLVIDLNYFEDSPGREFALRHGARYISGLKMFQTQAQGQREFWLSSLQGELEGTR